MQLLVRKSPKVVFNAFINPEVTTQFWFTKSSGKLEQGKTVTWEWEMYGVKDEVTVLAIQPAEKITIRWGKPSCKVDFNFGAYRKGQTLVKITCYDFEHKKKDLLPVMLDYTGGFTTVLDGLKCYLKHNIRLNLVEDKFPDKIK